MTEKIQSDIKNKPETEKNTKKKDVEKKKKIKETSTSGIRKLSLSIPWKEIEKKFDEIVENYSSEIKLPGFRKGRVPVDVIRNKYKEAINDEVVNKLIDEYTFKEIKEKNIKIASNPIIEKFEFKDGEALEAEVRLDLMPEVVIPEIKGIEIKIKKDMLKTEEYNEQKQIDSILESNKKKNPAKDREIRNDDFIEFRIQSQFADSKRMMPKISSNFIVEKENEFEIQDFYKEIIGKKKEDRLSFSRTYPEDSKKKSWSGKKINHLIEILAVYEFVKPDFNEEFVKSIGFEDKKKFIEKLKDEYLKHTKKHREEVVIAEIRDNLLEICKFDVPETFVEQEINRTSGQYGQFIMSLPEDKRNEYINSMRINAEKSLKFSFIIEEIKKKYDIHVGSEDLEKEYKIVAEANNIDIKDVRKYYLKKENKETLTDNMERNRSIEFLKDNIKIKEV